MVLGCFSDLPRPSIEDRGEATNMLYNKLLANLINENQPTIWSQVFLEEDQNMIESDLHHGSAQAFHLLLFLMYYDIATVVTIHIFFCLVAF